MIAVQVRDEQQRVGVNPTRMVHWRCEKCSPGPAFRAYCGAQLAGLPMDHRDVECAVCLQLEQAGAHAGCWVDHDG